MIAREYIFPTHQLVSIDLHRCGGQPCFVGTRLPADLPALARTERGFTDQQIHEWWPAITDEQIAASVAWCADPDRQRIVRNARRCLRRAEGRQP